MCKSTHTLTLDLIAALSMTSMSLFNEKVTIFILPVGGNVFLLTDTLVHIPTSVHVHSMYSRYMPAAPKQPRCAQSPHTRSLTWTELAAWLSYCASWFTVSSIAGLRLQRHTFTQQCIYSQQWCWVWGLSQWFTFCIMWGQTTHWVFDIVALKRDTTHHKTVKFQGFL